ncbi:hypothetical protein GX50_09026 [[Emmonsia] crescens]|uniref:Uncharacterized protein n=1 Tax=[Emmonsia] crescens TaxID=73230 RepID=A0A2B7XUD6_9EURO|nr:hypothetical protein GX50_09026 [Emmonsia crescens]
MTPELQESPRTPAANKTRRLVREISASPSVNPESPSALSRAAEEEQSVQKEVAESSRAFSPLLGQSEDDLLPPPRHQLTERGISKSSSSQSVQETERAHNGTGKKVGSATNSYKCTDEFQRRWLNGKPRKPESLEEQLRCRFWGRKDYLPRCYSCRVSNVTLGHNDIPDGSAKRDVLPCGCDYEDAILEMWMVQRGVWKKFIEKGSAPKTGGKHRVLLRALFEQFFGAFSVEKVRLLS